MRKSFLSAAAWVALLIAAVAREAACAVAPPSLPPRTQPLGTEQLATSINTFGSSLFSAVLSKGESSQAGVFLSPFGISQALGMLLNGADPSGQSYAQLLSAVFGQQAGNASAAGGVNSGMKSIAGWLLQAAPATGQVTLSVANSAWLSEEYELQQAFEATVSQYYSAAMEPITTAEAVNSWVSNATRGKIDEIVDDATMEDAALVLIDALYFKAQWGTPFDKSMTKRGAFRQLSGESVDVAMMEHDFDGDEGSDAKVALFSAPLTPNSTAKANVPCVAVKLAYYKQQYTAYLAMPAGNTSTSAGPLRLDPTGLPYQDALSACRTHLLKGLSGGVAHFSFQPATGMLMLKLPRFEVGYGTSLKAALEQLGIRQPFLGGDLTRLATSADNRTLFVSDVAHKVYFKVDEVGTEASAATSIVVMPTSLRLGGNIYVEFDRPFAVVVSPEGSGLPLFVGEVYEPELWTGA